jgi:hypothetical protein
MYVHRQLHLRQLFLDTDKIYLLLLLGIFLHAGLDPLATLSGVLFHFGLVLEQLPDGVRIRHMAAFFHARTRFHSVQPGLERRELVNIDASPTSSRNPTVVCNV